MKCFTIECGTTNSLIRYLFQNNFAVTRKHKSLVSLIFLFYFIFYFYYLFYFILFYFYFLFYFIFIFNKKFYVATFHACKSSLIISFAILGKQDATQSATGGLSISDIGVVVRSQKQTYHTLRALAFREHFSQQLTHLSHDQRPRLAFLHEQWPDVVGSWTLFPLVPEFAVMFKDKKWLIICDEETRLNLTRLPQFLQRYNFIQNFFIGQGLVDREATIIHHFASTDGDQFFYPLISSGFALTLPLLIRLAEHLISSNNQQMKFSIDVNHEFAKYLMDHLDVRLLDACEFCGSRLELSNGCQCVASQPAIFPGDCGHPINKEDLFVAVKTCSKYHHDRIPVVKQTWAKDAAKIEYYSEVVDEGIPTVNC